jgi:hypothetical protein
MTASALLSASPTTSDVVASESTGNDTQVAALALVTAASPSDSSSGAASDGTSSTLPTFVGERTTLLREDPLSAAGTPDQMQAALTTYFSTTQIAGRFDAAAAKPVVLPQTAPRESDLILTGKQSARLMKDLPGENADEFFRQSFKFLLSPEQEMKDQKSDETTPQVPGAEGNVDPGAQPQKDGTDSVPSREADDADRKEGSLTWAGLVFAAASGIRALRNRRRRQRTAA